MHVIEFFSQTDEARVQSAALFCSPQLGGKRLSSQPINHWVRLDPEGSAFHIKRTPVGSIQCVGSKKHTHTQALNWPPHPHAYTVHSTLVAHSPRLYFRKPSGSAPDIIVDLVNEHLTTCEARIKSSPVALNAQPWVKRREWKDFMAVKRGTVEAGHFSETQYRASSVRSECTAIAQFWCSEFQSKKK